MNFIFIILFSLYSYHPFHVSVCEIEYKRNENSLQVAHRIFADDLENALKQMKSGNLDIYNSDQSKVYPALEQYLDQNFAIQIPDKNLTTQFIGYEIEKDVVWCYQELKTTGNFDLVKIESTILFDQFDDQQNIIHLAKAGEVKSLMLNPKNSSGTLSFK